MFNIFRKKHEEKPTPPWLMWLVILFLGYAIISNQNKESHTRKAIDEATQNIKTNAMPDMDELSSKLFPETPAKLVIKDEIIGSGAPAVCGQELRIAYSAELSDTTIAKEHASKEAPLTLRLGERKSAHIFEEGLIGMRTGGKRSLIAPISMTDIDASQLKSPDKNARAKLEVELLEITPSLPDSFSSAFRIAEVAPGRGSIILCGDTLKAHVTLWDIGGKKLYSSRDAKRPIEFTPGKSEVFLGLEQGVIGMNVGGTRTLIVPPNFQKTMRGNAPEISLPIPKKSETVLVDVEALP